MPCIGDSNRRTWTRVGFDAEGPNEGKVGYGLLVGLALGARVLSGLLLPAAAVAAQTARALLSPPLLLQ
jgi:hypothetical protein